MRSQSRSKSIYFSEFSRAHVGHRVDPVCRRDDVILNIHLFTTQQLPTPFIQNEKRLLSSEAICGPSFLSQKHKDRRLSGGTERGSRPPFGQEVKKKKGDTRRARREAAHDLVDQGNIFPDTKTMFERDKYLTVKRTSQTEESVQRNHPSSPSYLIKSATKAAHRPTSQRAETSLLHADGFIRVLRMRSQALRGDTEQQFATVGQQASALWLRSAEAHRVDAVLAALPGGHREKRCQ